MSRCATCDVALTGAEELRAHYGSDLHLTNVRRRVEGLRPMNDQQLRHHRTGEEETGEGLDAAGAPIFSCTLCKKTFRSVQTLQTHVRSTAHLMRKEQRIIARDGEAATMLTSTSLGSAAMGLHRRHKAKRVAPAEEKVKAPKVSAQDREEDATSTRCMFCGLPSETVESNMEHLNQVHQFYIPMSHHCTDVHGLLDYLSRKVNGLVCLVCNEKSRSFPSLEAVRAHMYESGHERFILSTEYQDFYACVLEDPDGANRVVLEGVRGDELVLAGGPSDAKKRILLRREAEVPRNRVRETEEQTTQRVARLTAQQEAMALVKQEQHEQFAERDKETQKTLRRAGLEQQQLQLRVDLRSNHLHAKGYDGNMLFS